MDPFDWFIWVLGFTSVPYALLAAYRYMARLFLQV